MFLKIRNRIDRELNNYAYSINKSYALSRLSPVLSKHIKEYILRQGKRIRPLLFVVGYLGFTKKPAKGLYRSALAFELLHDFFLIHDDIIDKSESRRGKPSMHIMFDRYLTGYQNLKFNGQDLAIITADMIFPLAVDAFLSIRENSQRKELALKKFMEAALSTGNGEFAELLLGLKPIEKVTKEDIYKIYDSKTAIYTFASPLAIGATLAAANKEEIDKLFNYGICIGRAFQIKDDIIGTFGEETQIGKSNLTDLQEAKKTLLIWHAYNHADKNIKLCIERILSKKKVNRANLKTIRKIISDCGALDYAKKEINLLIQKSNCFINKSTMWPAYKKHLINFSVKILNLQ